MKLTGLLWEEHFTSLCVAYSLAGNCPSLGFTNLETNKRTWVLAYCLKGDQRKQVKDWGSETGKEEKPIKGLLSRSLIANTQALDSVGTSQKCTKCFSALSILRMEMRAFAYLLPSFLLNWKLSSEALTPLATLPFWVVATGKWARFIFRESPKAEKQGATEHARD